MPLIRQYNRSNNYPDLQVWRYFCDCMTPSHILEVVKEGEMISFDVYLPKAPLWNRLKMIWYLLWNKEVLYDCIFIMKEDREELANILTKES